MKLWDKMRERYGASWTFGDYPTSAWIGDLEGIKDQDLIKGFIALKDMAEYADWPPKSSAFYLICKPRIIKKIRRHKFKRYERSKESNKLMNDLKVKL